SARGALWALRTLRPFWSLWALRAFWPLRSLRSFGAFWPFGALRPLTRRNDAHDLYQLVSPLERRAHWLLVACQFRPYSVLQVANSDAEHNIVFTYCANVIFSLADSLDCLTIDGYSGTYWRITISPQFANLL